MHTKLVLISSVILNLRKLSYNSFNSICTILVAIRLLKITTELTAFN